MQPKPLKEYLEGDRLVLKKHSLELAETMFEYVEKDRERLSIYLPWVPSMQSVRDERNFILRTFKEWDEMTLFDYGIWLKETDVYMGNIGVHSLSWGHESAELGYWILGDFEGKGYVSESVQILESALFDHGFNRLIIRCDAGNEKSANVPKRNNYVLEGVQRQDYKYIDGTFRDSMTYSKLKQER